MTGLNQDTNEIVLDDEYIDITNEIFESLRFINDNSVVQSPHFNLLEGTRAIEMNNVRLDTGLIPLTEEEIKFDSSQPRDIQEVIGTMNRLLKVFIGWLNNSSLPVTVLSCRYVQVLLENYKNFPQSKSTLDKCDFKNKRFESQAEHDETSIEFKLVNKVLRSFVIGLCKFVGLCLNIANNVLYEEEDLTTRNMELNFLIDVSSDLVFKDINESIQWVKENIRSDCKEIIIHYLELVIKMNEINSMLNISMCLFEYNDGVGPKIKFLNDAISIIEKLSNVIEYKAPSGSFSKFVQLDSGNRNIPSDLYEASQSDTYKSLSNLFQILINFIGDLAKVKNLNQFQNFLKFNFSYRINENFNVISRGFFQLFLIRDDKSIMGSNVSINSLSIKLIENLIGINSIIFKPDEWNIQGTELFVQTSKSEVIGRLDILFNDIEAGLYHNLTTSTNNRCRQRQLTSKSLLIWDTLQVNFENFEIEIWEKFKIGDELINEEVGLSVSSYIYFIKLEQMLEVALTGFELKIYKQFEFCLMYWYISYLSQLIIEHLASRINKLVEQKINYITITFPKRIKKLKSGSKKNKLKEINKCNHENILPNLQKILDYNQIYLIGQYKSLNILTDAIRMYLILLSSLNLIDFIKGPKNSMTTIESLFKLRMKPWSSIGVPNLPTFDQYKNSINTDFLNVSNKRLKIKQLIKITVEKFNQAERSYLYLLQNLEKGKIEDQFINGGIEDWYNSLIETCQIYSVELQNLMQIVDNEELTRINQTNYRIEIKDGPHRYFANISVSKL